jgi:hypothetical protein
MNRKNSRSVPLEIYHGVPKGWSKDEIINEYRRLGGTFLINGKEATEPGTPSFLPDRYNWLQYRETLYRISEGVKANDSACIELAIRYIELNYIGSYSGFIRAKLARALKGAILAKSQKKRLRTHFKRLIVSHECFQEFSEYKKLLERIDADETND